MCRALIRDTHASSLDGTPVYFVEISIKRCVAQVGLIGVSLRKIPLGWPLVRVEVTSTTRHLRQTLERRPNPHIASYVQTVADLSGIAIGMRVWHWPCCLSLLCAVYMLRYPI